MKTSETLKEILQKSLEEYNRLADQDRDQILRSLAPGQKAPATGKLYTDGAKKAYKDYTEKAKARAFEVIDTEIAKTNKAIAAAPSTEAINTLTALSIAKSKDPRDYEAVYAEYGRTVQVAKALNALAKENGVRFLVDTPELDRLESLQSIRSTFNSFLRDTNVPDNGRVSFIGWDIDNAGID